MTRPAKVLLASAVVLSLLGGAALTVPALRFSERKAEVSVKAAPEYQDPALLEKAWGLPVARLYRPGIEYQHNGSFCGPASVVNVLRSLGLPADQQTVLEGTGVSTSNGLILGGMTLEELAELARKKLKMKVTAIHELGLAEFRLQLRRANDPAVRLIINFHRGPIFAEGGGHHSPIAGYLAGEDLVLVLDVNQKYQPWLVKSERLYEAMNTVDKTAGKKRGLLVIER